MLLKGEAGALKAEVDMRMGSAASSLPLLWALDATLEMKPRQIQGQKSSMAICNSSPNNNSHHIDHLEVCK